MRNVDLFFTRLPHYKCSRFMINEYGRGIHRNGDEREIN